MADEIAHIYIIAHGRCSTKPEVVLDNTVIVFYVNEGESLVNKTKTTDWESNASDMFSRIREYVESKSHPEDPSETKGPGETYRDMVFYNEDEIKHMGVYDSSYTKIVEIPKRGIHLSTILKQLDRDRASAPVPLNAYTNVVHVISCRGIHGTKSTPKKVGGKSRRKRYTKGRKRAVNS